MALLLKKALRKQDKEVPANPETFAKDGEVLRNELSDRVVFCAVEKHTTNLKREEKN